VFFAEAGTCQVPVKYLFVVGLLALRFGEKLFYECYIWQYQPILRDFMPEIHFSSMFFR
jgi:hypothetical protein